MELPKNPKELVPRKHQYIQDIMKNYKVVLTTQSLIRKNLRAIKIEIWNSHLYHLAMYQVKI